MTEPAPPQPPTEPDPHIESAATTPAASTEPPPTTDPAAAPDQSPWARPSSPHYSPAPPGYQTGAVTGEAGPSTWPATPAQVRRRAGTGLVALVAVLAVLLCGGAGVAGALLLAHRDPGAPTDANAAPPSGQGGGPPAPSTPEPATAGPSEVAGPWVSYQVTGEGPAQISYLEYPNFPRQVGTTVLPWRVEFTMPDPGVVTVLAIRTTTGPGEITCRIVVDGEEVVANTANGPYATATCAGLTLG